MSSRLARSVALRSLAVARSVVMRSSSSSAASPAATSLIGHLDTFARRHNGSSAEIEPMLNTIGVRSLDEMINSTVPSSIRLPKPLSLAPALGERAAVADLREIMSKNKVMQSFLGQGYYDTVTPAPILRNILENPQWYTPYTPYQAEISQGRMESLVNYQQMIVDLTKADISNASLLDEATAAAEAMALAFTACKQKRFGFFVDEATFSQTIDVIKARAHPLGIKVHIGDFRTFDFAAADCMGALVQYPNRLGEVHELGGFIERAHAAKSLAIVGTDLLALTLLKAPGELGADVVYGSSQRFGVPMGFGGPHAAFFAVREAHARKLPGRLIGLTKDAQDKAAFRLTLQTREQHIRRAQATSNICTAQALLANVAAMYAVYHGADGLRQIAQRTKMFATAFAAGAKSLGHTVPTDATFFDTVGVEFTSDAAAKAFIDAAYADGMLLLPTRGRSGAARVQLSFDETVDAAHIERLWAALAGSARPAFSLADVVATLDSAAVEMPGALRRSSEFLTHPNFKLYQTEHELLRYMNRLQSKDVGLHNSGIFLGSCTMKLNATSEMIPLTWPTVGRLHPFAPRETTLGYYEMLRRLESDLCEITGFAAVSLQPNSGAAGEYAGLLAIRGFNESRGQAARNVCLIPTSAHGTNAASAAMAGFQVVAINTTAAGEVDLADLRAKAAKHGDKVAALMITYPSTFGMFEAGVREACEIVHSAGGQVYMDGANMNAQVGLTSPGHIGADVCHLNLHKTFCIPHGGGGPGMGPIGVAKHLARFLPTHSASNHDWSRSKYAVPVAAAPYGSASILTISYQYIRMMGAAGLTAASVRAILNANYMASRLTGHYEVLYRTPERPSAHEFILDLRPLEKSTGVQAIDVAKRLQDYGFHAPTMSWPVPGTLMIEPTESETKAELDRFCDAMISIRAEIAEIESGAADRTDNTLKNAPHTAEVVTADTWPHKYSREKAAYPLPWLKRSGRKFWPSVGRAQDVYGDTNLFCLCPPIEDVVAATAPK